MLLLARTLRPALGVATALLLAIPAFAANDALTSASSGFLRSHADNPVAWQRWSPEAVAKAREANKPIFLVIGSVTHELSRAMNRQTFGNSQVATLLNAEFVCILVDREEYPVLGAYAQAYLSQKKQLSGWPVNVWLTPELKPFEGATYLPPSEEWGKEGFMNVAQRAVSAWKGDPDAQLQKGDDAVADLIDVQAMPPPPAPTAESLRERLATQAQQWVGKQDPGHAGFGEPPRFAEPELLRFLLTQGDASRDAALHALRSLGRSAARDPLDGGFFRATADAAGRVPSPVKTSLDQARIALAFLEAAAATQEAEFSQAARGALDYAYTELRSPQGTYIAALDGSTEEARGGFSWTQDEIQQALGTKLAEEFNRVHGVTPDGNVRVDDDPSGKLKGRNLLYWTAADPKENAGLVASRAKLRAVRAKRVPLLRDETIAAATQGWMLAALATAGEVLKEPRYSERARELAAALGGGLVDPAKATVVRLAGSPAPASSNDLVSLAYGYGSLGDETSRALAGALLKRALSDAFDAEHGRFYAGLPLTPELPLRPHAPDTAPADLPRPELAAFLAQKRLAGAEPFPAALQTAARALLGGWDEAVEPIRGDALLAASVFASAPPAP